MIFNHFVLAWRNLLRHKAFTIINIIGLSMGITSALVISLFIRYETSFDQFHARSNDIYKVVQETKFAEETYYWNTTAYPLAEAIRNDFAQIPLVTQVSGPVNRMFRIEDEGGNISRYEEQYVLYVDPFYPKVFDIAWIQGDPNTALSKPNTVVLTRSLAKKYFGKDGDEKSLLGRSIFLNNKDALTVTGLIEDAPPTTSLKYSMLIPYEFFRINNPYPTSNWSGNYQGTTFIVLKKEQGPAELEKQLHTWKKKYLKPEDDNRIDYRLQPLKESHTDEKFGSAPQSYTMPSKVIYAAAGTAVFMLMIACVNFINLATAQAAGRAREVGVRKVMGSSRFGLVKQFLYEHTLLVSVTVLLSIALTQLSISGINQMLAIIQLQLSMDWTLFALAICIGCVIIVLACLYPSIVMASYRPVEALKNKIGSSTSGLSLRRALIVVQFSIVQLFIIGTLVVGSQMNFLKYSDMGFSQEDPVLVTNLNELDKREAFQQKLLTNPEIKEVSFSSSGPLSDYNHHYGTSFRLPGQREEEAREAEEKGADMNFISFYKLELLAGRNFSAVEKEIFTEFIVNEQVIKAFNWTPEEAIGRKLIINEGEAVVVGVVRDFHNNSLKDEITPCFLLNSAAWLDRTNIKLHSRKNLPATMAFIESAWKELYPEGIYNYTFLDDALLKNYALEELIFNGFSVFSIITIVIGCLGLFGLLSFMTIRKTKEVGIRKVLGASVAQIVALFGKEFVLLVVLAFGIAAPSCYYFMNQWLNGFAYHIDLSWWMFVTGVLFTLGIALLTICYQSIRAALANPVDALRNE